MRGAGAHGARSQLPWWRPERLVQAYGDPSRHQVQVRVPTIGAETGQSLSATKDAVVAALQKSNVGEFKVAGSEIVGPTVGAELTSKGLWATVLSLIGILMYLAFRFQFSFGVGAVVATMHDLLITLAFLAFFRYDMSLNVIAAILTMTGFSTNDTIVIFDRIRENLRTMRRDSMYDVINASVNQTLGRTVITSGTALLTALALFFFGGEVLHGFAFTMIVGIITGTYSSVFIAAAIVSFWRGTAPTRAARACAGHAGRTTAGAAAADAQDQGAAQSARVVDRAARPFKRRSSASSRASPNFCRVVDGAPADRRAASRLPGSGRRVHRDDPARIDLRRRLALSPESDRRRYRAADAARARGRSRSRSCWRPSRPWLSARCYPSSSGPCSTAASW